MEKKEITYDYMRGCVTERKSSGELSCCYSKGCCKLGVFNWLDGIENPQLKDLVEVRFKNTRKAIYRNASNQTLRQGDIVVVEANNGHDVGIVTLCGAIIANQLQRHGINPDEYEFKKLYRKAKTLDIERWQEAIAREHHTMIRSRQIAASMGLNMKIGDVEFQGDGTKAIFYYIADERVDFRQLIKVFAEEFKIRIEMKQIGARQEAGLIGGIGVCGQPLCCSRYMSAFRSITTFSAKCQDLSLNPQRLAGQCGKLKCCINYEAAQYIDAHKKLPVVNQPLEFADGLAYLVKTDTLKEIMWFSYDPHSMTNMHPLTAKQVNEIQNLNIKGARLNSLTELTSDGDKEPEFMSAVGEDSISRFDNMMKNRKKKKKYERNDRVEKSSENLVDMKALEEDVCDFQNESGKKKEDRPKNGKRGGESRRDGRRGHDDRKPRENREGRPKREDRQPKEDRPQGEDRQPKEGRPKGEDRQPKEGRPQREERQSKEGRPQREERQPREARPERQERSRKEPRTLRDDAKLSGLESNPSAAGRPVDREENKPKERFRKYNRNRPDRQERQELE